MGAKKKQEGPSPSKGSSEYLEKRVKNNTAVKRSRDRSKRKAQEAKEQVEQLADRNEELKVTVENMTEQLKYLKEVLVNQAGSSSRLNPEMESKLLRILENDYEAEDLEDLQSILTELNKIQKASSS